MSRSPRARWAALFIALPLLAGCSAGAHASGPASPSAKSASSGSASSAELGPCDYLSAADASTIVGVTVTSSEADGACSYTSGSGGEVAFATTVTPISGPSDPNWKEEVESFTDATKLSGLGDEAYGSTSSFEAKIAVRKGNTVIEVANADGSDATTYPKSIAIAKAIIAKLG